MGISKYVVDSVGVDNSLLAFRKSAFKRRVDPRFACGGLDWTMAVVTVRGRSRGGEIVPMLM